jgi:hypothetical protein
MRFNTQSLRAFVDEANSANVMYYATRRQLFTMFTEAIDRVGETEVDSTTVVTIRTFLSNRENKPSDQARLAYEVALMSLNELVG